MIRLVVTGRDGQVARSLVDRMPHHPAIEVIAVGRPDLDLERESTVAGAIARARPDLVVNAAAFTAVDRAEREPERAFAVNRDGAGAVARAAAGLGVPLIHLSTDYVYAGDKPGPYVETDPVGPLGVYGRSKLDGEAAVAAACPAALILRTAWVFSPFGSNFVKTMLRLGAERQVLRVVDDQIGNPTGALDIADAILRLAPVVRSEPRRGGVLHLAGTGTVSWHGFAVHIFAATAARGGPHPQVLPIVTADYPTPARRPANSRLDCTAFRQRFGFALPPWQAAADTVVTRLLG